MSTVEELVVSTTAGDSGNGAREASRDRDAFGVCSFHIRSMFKSPERLVEYETPLRRYQMKGLQGVGAGWTRTDEGVVAVASGVKPSPGSGALWELVVKRRQSVSKVS